MLCIYQSIYSQKSKSRRKCLILELYGKIAQGFGVFSIRDADLRGLDAYRNR